MKHIFTAISLVILSQSVFANESILVNGKLNNSSGKNTDVFVYAEYQATRDSVFCRHHGIPDGGYQSFPKTSQRLIQVNKSSQLNGEVALEYGHCKYQPVSLKLLVVTQEFTRMLKQNSDLVDQVEDNVYEFKGTFSGHDKAVEINNDSTGRSRVNCQHDTSKVADCGTESIYLQNDQLNLNIDVK